MEEKILRTLADLLADQHRAKITGLRIAPAPILLALDYTSAAGIVRRVSPYAMGVS